MENPIVSIVIPCYNQSQYLAETLDSLLTQSYKNWEAIIVNDGSTDNSEQVIKTYIEKDLRFRYILQNNVGPSSARNKGVSIATGKYILPLDGDDKISPLYLEKAISYLENNPDCTLYYCVAEYFGDIQGLWNMRYSNYENLLLGNSIFCTAIYRKEDFERVGGYDESMKGYEDWEFFIRLLYPDKRYFNLRTLCFIIVEFLIITV